MGQKIKCEVKNCKHCDCDNDVCTMKEIEVCNCCGELDKEATICNSFEKD